jgi:hypothetical protein
MNTSLRNGNGNGKYRRFHRRFGATLVAFVLFLSITGIALNHSSDLGLDRKYISWSWLLDAYGLEAPKPYAGRVVVEPMVVVGDGQTAHVLLTTGELVESIDLGGFLPGDIERVGRVQDRVVLQSGGQLFQSDADVSLFESWEGEATDEIEWSSEIAADTAGLETLQTAWRGRGVTAERVLLDLHSGRIFALPGRLVLDIIGLGLIVLSISGLVLAGRRSRKL